MKKIFLMLLGIAATINVMAVDYTAKAKVRVSSTTGFYCDLMLSESAEYGALTGSPIYLSGYKVALYAINGTEQLQIARANSLNDVQLALKTDDGTDYTFTVSSVAGDETLYFMDALGENYALTEGASFTIYDLAANSTIADRFTLGRPSAPQPTCTTVRENLEIGRYYTICLPQDIVSFNGGTFWSMSKRGVGVAYLEGEDAPLTAGQPYIFQATAEELCVVYGNAVPAAEAGAAGALKGTFAAMGQAALSDAATAYGSPIYLLYNNELRPAAGAGNNLPAKRAFIVYNLLDESEPNPAPGRRVRAIPMQTNGATAFENVDVEAAKAVKFMEDGKIFIKRGDAIYNLQGQLVK